MKALICVIIMATFLYIFIGITYMHKRVELTEYEKKLLRCMTKGFASGTPIYDFPSNPYVMYKGKMVYLNSKKCENKIKQEGGM